jgi:hypothetical protein
MRRSGTLTPFAAAVLLWGGPYEASIEPAAAPARLRGSLVGNWSSSADSAGHYALLQLGWDQCEGNGREGGGACLRAMRLATPSPRGRPKRLLGPEGEEPVVSPDQDPPLDRNGSRETPHMTQEIAGAAARE